MSPWLLIAGGAALLAVAKGKAKGGGGGSIYFIDAECNPIQYTPQTQQEAIRLLARVAQLAAKGMTNLGFPMTPEEAASPDSTLVVLRKALGPAPGVMADNIDFARAYAEEVTRLATDPRCSLGDPWPAAAMIFSEQTFSETAMQMAMQHGYDMGVQYASTTLPRSLPEGLLARMIR